MEHANIADSEESKHNKMWMVPMYRSLVFGENYVKHVVAELGIKKGDEVIDFGCGTGKTAKALCKKGISVHGIDIAENALNEEMHSKELFYFSKQCLWQLNSKVLDVDYAICTSVMEQIPEKLVHAVLYQIAKKTLKAGFFAICTEQESLGPKHINQQLNVTVRSGRWWADQLERYWDVTFAEDVNNLRTYLYYVKVRKEDNAEWKQRDR